MHRSKPAWAPKLALAWHDYRIDLFRDQSSFMISLPFNMANAIDDTAKSEIINSNFLLMDIFWALSSSRGISLKKSRTLSKKIRVKFWRKIKKKSGKVYKILENQQNNMEKF